MKSTVIEKLIALCICTILGCAIYGLLVAFTVLVASVLILLTSKVLCLF